MCYSDGQPGVIFWFSYNCIMVYAFLTFSHPPLCCLSFQVISKLCCPVISHTTNGAPNNLQNPDLISLKGLSFISQCVTALTCMLIYKYLCLVRHAELKEEAAHLHFRAWFSNLCRPLLICSSLPHPSLLNGNKPKQRVVQRTLH